MIMGMDRSSFQGSIKRRFLSLRRRRILPSSIDTSRDGAKACGFWSFDDVKARRRRKSNVCLFVISRILLYPPKLDWLEMRWLDFDVMRRMCDREERRKDMRSEHGTGSSHAAESRRTNWRRVSTRHPELAQSAFFYQAHSNSPSQNSHKEFHQNINPNLLGVSLVERFTVKIAGRAQMTKKLLLKPATFSFPRVGCNCWCSWLFYYKLLCFFSKAFQWHIPQPTNQTLP